GMVRLHRPHPGDPRPDRGGAARGSHGRSTGLILRRPSAEGVLPMPHPAHQAARVVGAFAARDAPEITTRASATTASRLTACRMLAQGAWSAPPTPKVSARVIPAGNDATK